MKNSMKNGNVDSALYLSKMLIEGEIVYFDLLKYIHLKHIFEEIALFKLLNLTF